MRKLLLLIVAAMSAVLLMSTTAFAAPVNSATERGPETEIEDPNVPLGENGGNINDPNTLPGKDSGEGVEIDDPNVPLGDIPGEGIEIDDPSVPLGDTSGVGIEADDPDSFGGVRSPQTGVTGLAGTECMTLLAAAFAVGGGAMLAKARKQAR